MAPDARFEAFGDHLTYIEQIEEDVARLKTRLEHITDKRLRRQVEADIRRLQARRLVEIKRLVAAVCAYEDLGGRHRLALSVPSVGERTALALVIRMPELGQTTCEQVASSAGLAPFVRQSGKWKGETHIGGGRAAATVAVRCGLPRRAPLEPGRGRPQDPYDGTRRQPHQRDRCLRAQAADPGQRRDRPWHPSGSTTARWRLNRSSQARVSLGSGPVPWFDHRRRSLSRPALPLPADGLPVKDGQRPPRCGAKRP